MIRAKNLMILLSGVILALAMALQPALAQDVTTLNGVGPDREFPRVSRSYPSLNAVSARDGTFRTPSQLRRVQIGDTKRALVNKAGQPVSSYGDGSWNFNVALPLQAGNQLICQYRVYFDEQDLVMGSLWRRPQCADIVNGR